MPAKPPPRAGATPTRPAVPPVAAAATPALLAWYDRARRRLPWRALPGETPDPYAVWLSEVMLQQTTVAAVKPFYARFLALWPTVSALAAAPVEEVMKAWAGLGYYSRARNLHKAAQAVARDHGGAFPDTEAALRGLPGIGAYTAAAVAAIAFGRDATVVDGNVERVMARLHAVEVPLPEARPLLRDHMAALTPSGRAGDFAQAVMDLGATICTPRSPACAICPVLAACAARRAGTQDVLPRRAPRKAAPLRHGSVWFIEAQGGVLVRRRPPRGLLGGMVELPGTAWTPVGAEPAAPAAMAGSGYAGRLTHTFTHFTLFLDVFRGVASVPDEIDLSACWPAAPEALREEALPTLMRNAVALAREEKPVRTRPGPASASPRRRRS